MSSVKTYFEKNAHNHAYHNDPATYRPIIKYIKENHKDHLKILDFGCGDGSFIKSLIGEGINATYVGTDVSHTMIRLARQNLPKSKVELFVADGFNLPLKPETKFDIIHLDSVLHHIIGNTRSKSNRLVKELLKQLVGRLNSNGSLIIEELYYDSHVFPQLTSFLIFYGLKALNFARLDISKILKEYSMGLEVNFFCNRSLTNTLSNYGKPQLIKNNAYKIPLLYKLLFLKKLGGISYAIVKNT